MSVSNEEQVVVSTRLDPPWVPIGQDYVTVSCSTTIRLVADDVPPVLKSVVKYINVGRLNASQVASIGQIGIDSNAYLSDPSMGTDPQLSYEDSICDAIEKCEEWLKKNDYEACHFVLLIHEQRAEDTQKLGQLIDATSRGQSRYDLVGTTGGLDLRLLSQAALLMGGVFLAPVDGTVDSQSVNARAKTLFNQRVSQLSVSFQWADAVLPVHVFSFAQIPQFLRDLGGESTPYAHRFHCGPLSEDVPAINFVFRCLVRRKHVGSYLLATVDISARSNGVSWTKTLEITQSASDKPALCERADPRLGLAVDRLRPTLWWEEICHAFTREDGNHIVRTFDKLISHEFEHGRIDAVTALSKMRMEFIRGGYFGLDALGDLWGYTHRACLDLTL
tara:strand:+ start:48 stop:1217 length:1170 start_codon:yes stop_codon:yes gene_type:complete